MTDSTNPLAARNLRAAADLLDAHPDIRQPYVTTSSSGRVDLAWYIGNDTDGRAQAAAVVSAIDGTWRRGEAENGGPMATWSLTRGGLDLYVMVSRDQVCERVVTGTETVTIPAVKAQPERTEVREVVEWRCQPLLADRDTEAVPV